MKVYQALVNAITFKNNITYVTHDYLSYGNYDNSCAVERANVRYLLKQHGSERMCLQALYDGQYYEDGKWTDLTPESELIEAYGGYGSVQIWIRKDIDNENRYIESLNDYPCFDDELVSEIEMEIENEYIKDNLSDILRYAPFDKDILDELCIDVSDETKLYHQAKKVGNICFEVEAGGNGYIDFEELAPYFFELLLEKYPAISIIDRLIKIEMPSFPDSYYTDSRDMLDHAKLMEREREILLYCEQLENILKGVKL